MSMKSDLQQFNRNLSTMVDQLKAKIVDKHKKYHVHVYRVLTMSEVDIYADSDTTALNTAIDTIDKQKFVLSDCNFLAIIPEEKGGDNSGEKGTKKESSTCEVPDMQRNQ